MRLDTTQSKCIDHKESRRDGLKHERITGQEEERNLIRARTHKVSDFRNHFLVQVSNKVLKLIKHDV
ncbi:hypothetical protein HanPI659440_Chr10g0373921 [Helianthus annuus]|nr:hypothetical protein HanPI659440_Chr10g0373921 [Helianthus annuus]